jgi:uncharacterized LabA/DUF88 family protein
MPTAIMIDGAYYLRRFRYSFPNADAKIASEVAAGVMILAAWHVATSIRDTDILDMLEHRRFDAVRNEAYTRMVESQSLYRIFFYDCPPLTKRMHHPVSNRSIVLGQSDTAILRTALHKDLNDRRKVALRLGRINEEYASWRPVPSAVKRWLDEPAIFNPSDEDFEIDVSQKGVDMRFGLDLASMAYQHHVDQIVMVTGDADFVPAAKLARREGIDVVLDPMHGPAAKDLEQHVDGTRSIKINWRTLGNK